MFLIERPAALPWSRPQTLSTAPGTPPVLGPAALGIAAGGAFELFPRHRFPGSGDLVQASMPAPFSAGPTWAVQPGVEQPRAEQARVEQARVEQARVEQARVEQAGASAEPMNREAPSPRHRRRA